MSEVAIGHEHAFLALSGESSIGLHARLVLPTLRAETHVHLTDDALEISLASFFSELAKAWRGWKGARSWATYERGMALVCEHDRLGHVRVSVELREYSGHGWLVRGDVPVDAGQLDQLSRDLAALVG
jgi:hypothetical protein